MYYRDRAMNKLSYPGFIHYTSILHVSRTICLSRLFLLSFIFNWSTSQKLQFYFLISYTLHLPL